MTKFKNRQTSQKVIDLHHNFFKTVDDYIKGNISSITGEKIGYMYFNSLSSRA